MNISKATSAFSSAAVHAAAEPRPLEGLAAERVAARPGEAVPVGDRDAQLVLHALAEHHAVGLVEAEGQRVVAVGALERDAARCP